MTIINKSNEEVITLLDTAWLWPYDETKRKIARSWSSQLNLIERYPEYVFTGSQVQQYEWLKELYPEVFEKIKDVEKTGQWEIIGGVSGSKYNIEYLFLLTLIFNLFRVGSNTVNSLDQ